MTKKLAVVISGAVSLGSYEAGVIYEVLEILAKHNETAEEDDRIEIDVITGASAGGMTACILAQQLLFSDEGFRKPYENSLFKAWVNEVDITDLLKFNEEYQDPQEKRQAQNRSIFNPKIIDRIAEKHLTNNIQSSASRHPAVGNELLVGIAMSNVSGFQYSVKPALGEPVEFNHFKDQFVCKIYRHENKKATLKELTLPEIDSSSSTKYEWQEFRDADWNELRDVGISSGAFPIAFPLKGLRREGQGKYLPRDSDNKPRSKIYGDQYLYTDGGVFENEPINMAYELVKQIDKGDSKNRYFLLIKPGVRQALDEPFLDKGENIISTGVAILNSIFQQAQFQDWALEGLKESRLLTITSTNDELLSDIFIAFSGFLDIKFRAYDYNIGRESAREKLGSFFRQGGKEFINFDPSLDLHSNHLPDIDWPLTSTKNDWESEKLKLQNAAKSRNQIEGFYQLLNEVELEKRRDIKDLILKRITNGIENVDLDNWINSVNHDIDTRNKEKLEREKNLLKKSRIIFNDFTRNKYGKPATKRSAKIFTEFIFNFISDWLDRNMVNIFLTDAQILMASIATFGIDQGKKVEGFSGVETLGFVNEVTSFQAGGNSAIGEIDACYVGETEREVVLAFRFTALPQNGLVELVRDWLNNFKRTLKRNDIYPGQGHWSVSRI